MRAIIYGLTILAASLFVVIAISHLPQVATASGDQANGAVDVPMLERTIDPKTLPQQEIPDEVYR